MNQKTVTLKKENNVRECKIAFVPKNQTFKRLIIQIKYNLNENFFKELLAKYISISFQSCANGPH